MIKVKLNGKVLFNGELGEWISRPPDEFRDVIKPGAKPAPYMKALMIVMADLALTQGSATITINANAKSWSMVVST